MKTWQKSVFKSDVKQMISCIWRCCRSSGGVDATAHSLSELAQLVLREICSQEWVLERCLQNPEELCTQDMLLDSMLSPKQVIYRFFY